jgi:iron complex transport system ATP-binding protein
MSTATRARRPEWAEAAEVGHRLHIIGPSRASETPCAGIEFAPGDANQILLAGDETAVPAIASILDSLKDSQARGKAVLEVPSAEDIIDIAAPTGFEIEWLPRGEADFGQLLEPAIREAVRSETRIPVGAGAAGSAGGPDGQVRELDDVNIDEEILWDVPAALTEAAQGSSSATDKDDRPFYAWIAGEAGPVKRLRRYPRPGSRGRPQADRIHGLLASGQGRGLSLGAGPRLKLTLSSGLKLGLSR